jgi:hypothetical protein
MAYLLFCVIAFAHALNQPTTDRNARYCEQKEKIAPESRELPGPRTSNIHCACSEGDQTLGAVNDFSVRPPLRDDLAVNDLFLAKAAIATIRPCRPGASDTESMANNSGEGH